MAENLAYWVKRIFEEAGNNASIILMGDFNDNPYDRSIKKYLQSSNVKKKVMNAKNHFFYNLMFRFLGNGTGTYVFGSEVNILDQFLISKNILSQSNSHPFKIEKVDKIESIKIVDFPEIVKGNYNMGIRFSRPR